YYYLELRKIADAGLVGYPNAGKSTLLSKLSAARPKVAAYPFTTLHPMVGIMEFPGTYERTTLADIPGLIEGAHRNVGLGHEFLRHIMRCRLLIFVLDMAGSEGRHPLEDLASLRRELSLYNAQLAERPWIVIGNKMDLPDAEENFRLLRERFPKTEAIPISAEQGTGMEDLRLRLRRLLIGDSGAA
ncbi:MAG: 50S ribosome-binding GTPase, partial [Rhodospirillales bacterium]|nr:50S ribosome-binding GTPase [Acetobacter sp.]